MAPRSSSGCSAELPGVCSVGEVVHLWQRGVVEDERCGCGEPFRDCAFWRDVGEAAFGGWSQLDVERVAALRAAVDRTRYIPLLAAPALRPPVRRDLDEYLGYYARVYSAIAEVSGCPVVVDSSKHASLAFCLRWQAGLDLRVVHVVRDSRAVAFSWARQVSRPDAATPSYMARYSPTAAAGHWNAQNGALQLLASGACPHCGCATRTVAAAAASGPGQDRGRSPGSPPDGRDFGFLGAEARHELGRAGRRAHRVRQPDAVHHREGRDPPGRPMAHRHAAAQRRTVTALTLPLLARYGYPGRAA